MKYLFIINGGPGGEEKAYNALRLGKVMQKEVNAEIRLFLMADAVANAVAGHNSMYDIEPMLKEILANGAEVNL